MKHHLTETHEPNFDIHNIALSSQSISLRREIIENITNIIALAATSGGSRILGWGGGVWIGGTSLEKDGGGSDGIAVCIAEI